MIFDVNIYRDQEIESTHKVLLTDLNSNKGFSLYLRSSFKPFQAYPVIYHQGHKKYRFTPSEIALLCASHNGEPRHIRAAKNMLKKINCSHVNLECGKH